MVELMRDLLNVPLSLRKDSQSFQAADNQAQLINGSEDMSPVRVSLHDGMFRVMIRFQPMLMQY